MSPFRSHEATAVAACAAVWAVLNAVISPFFWQLTHMPFLCDLLAFASLILVLWWTRRFGSASLTGLIFGILSFILRPGNFFLVAFMAASIVFDVLARAVGYSRLFSKSVGGSLSAIAISIGCAVFAGAIIGGFFMGFTTPVAVAAFAGLHAVGGLIGGAIGIFTVNALADRKIGQHN